MILENVDQRICPSQTIMQNCAGIELTTVTTAFIDIVYSMLHSTVVSPIFRYLEEGAWFDRYNHIISFVISCSIDPPRIARKFQWVKFLWKLIRLCFCDFSFADFDPILVINDVNIVSQIKFSPAGGGARVYCIRQERIRMDG